MGVLCPAVQPFVLPVLHARQDFAFRCSIAFQLIGDDHAWDILQPLEQFAAFERGLIAPFASRFPRGKLCWLVLATSTIRSCKTRHNKKTIRRAEDELADRVCLSRWASWGSSATICCVGYLNILHWLPVPSVAKKSVKDSSHRSCSLLSTHQTGDDMVLV